MGCEGWDVFVGKIRENDMRISLKEVAKQQWTNAMWLLQALTVPKFQRWERERATQE